VMVVGAGRAIWSGTEASDASDGAYGGGEGNKKGLWVIAHAGGEIWLMA
jgi:hypothetical protein